MWRRLAAGGHEAEHSRRFKSDISFDSRHPYSSFVDAPFGGRCVDDHSGPDA
jgi:hypothetical protein